MKLFREAKQKHKKETNAAKKKGVKGTRRTKSQASAAHGKAHAQNVQKWVQACAQANKEMGGARASNSYQREPCVRQSEADYGYFVDCSLSQHIRSQGRAVVTGSRGS